MRAIRFVGHKKAAMERSARAHTARQCCCGFQNVWSAQTVTMGPDLPLAVNLVLLIQERNVGQGVPPGRTNPRSDPVYGGLMNLISTGFGRGHLSV